MLFCLQVALLLDLHTVVLLVSVVWTFQMEDTASVINSALKTILVTINITTAALTIPVKVMYWILACDHANLT